MTYQASNQPQQRTRRGRRAAERPIRWTDAGWDELVVDRCIAPVSNGRGHMRGVSRARVTRPSAGWQAWSSVISHRLVRATAACVRLRGAEPRGHLRPEQGAHDLRSRDRSHVQIHVRPARARRADAARCRPHERGPVLTGLSGWQVSGFWRTACSVPSMAQAAHQRCRSEGSRNERRARADCRRSLGAPWSCPSQPRRPSPSVVSQSVASALPPERTRSREQIPCPTARGHRSAFAIPLGRGRGLTPVCSRRGPRVRSARAV